jgi:cytochrome c-type biogenesis protein CcmH
MSAIRKMLLVLAAGILAAGAFAAAARAQEPTPIISDDEVNAIASEMFCPVCENVPLDVCPTQACHQWRETIRQLLGEGMSEAEIKAHFVERYGDRVLSTPPRRGLNWLIYLVPPVVILIGALALVRTLRGWRVKTVPTGEAGLPPIPKDDYTRRLEDELERRA